jgi:histidyl-tRNA synthetase
MRLFPPHFACPALLPNIPRHTIVRHKFTRLAAPARPFLPLRVYSVQSSIGAIDDDMGKDDKSKNFNLKVPKGTRDCTPRSLLLFNVVWIKSSR